MTPPLNSNPLTPTAKAVKKGAKPLVNEAQRFFLAVAKKKGWKDVDPALATPENLYCPIKPPAPDVIERETIRLPYRDGFFRAITVDMPWDYGDRRFNGFSEVQKYRVSCPYECMHLYNIWQCGHEIRRVASPLGCHLWPWGTCHFDLAMRAMMEAWGWTHKTIYPWVKTTDGLNRGHIGLKGFTNEELAIAERVMATWGQHGKPAYVMGRWGRQLVEYMHLATSSNAHKLQNAASEPALIMAPDGNYPYPCPQCGAENPWEPTGCDMCLLPNGEVIFGNSTAHSRKPDAAFDIIRRNSHGPRLSMFEREARKGFLVWGHEAPK